MNNLSSTILENIKISEGVYKLMLDAPDNEFRAPGQFAMVKVPEKFLRRPISVCSYDSERYTMIYKVVGDGTDRMSRMKPGNKLETITGLGNGYDVDAIPDNALIIGGGIGIPPMLGLAKSLVMAGKSCRVVLGYNTKEDIFLLEDFHLFTKDITVMTADGSSGKKGLVTDSFDTADYACACGPLPMLKALAPKVKHGQFSLEARMGCGFGACMGCSIHTKAGSQRVCKEGPVFDKEVLLWDTL